MRATCLAHICLDRARGCVKGRWSRLLLIKACAPCPFEVDGANKHSDAVHFSWAHQIIDEAISFIRDPIVDLLTGLEF
jgi:hypothetical protein